MGLTKIEVREVVIETVKELRNSGLLRRQDDVAYAEMAARLIQYYKEPEHDRQMADVLEKMQGDYYFNILPEYYKHRNTIEIIAEEYGCEISTVTRNKKRLCLQLYLMLTDD